MVDAGRLRDLVASFPSLLVGYSGGVDSALLAVVARQVLGRGRMAAALGVSASLPASQRRQAHHLAGAYDVPLLEVPTDELSLPDYVANAPSRCYFCKHELWTKLTALAQERGLAVVADGTNADDVTEHRPGLRAAAAFGVRSPLAEAGYTKALVRNQACALGIPIWDAPAAPCLSSRIMYGLSVTPARLRQIEAAEELLRVLGIEGDLRVRHHGDEARIEVMPSQLGRVRRYRERVVTRLRELGFERVTLDLAGYRRGGLLGPRPQARRLEVWAGSG